MQSELWIYKLKSSLVALTQTREASILGAIDCQKLSHAQKWVAQTTESGYECGSKAAIICLSGNNKLNYSLAGTDMFAHAKFLCAQPRERERYFFFNTLAQKNNTHHCHTTWSVRSERGKNKSLLFGLVRAACFNLCKSEANFWWGLKFVHWSVLCHFFRGIDMKP